MAGTPKKRARREAEARAREAAGMPPTGPSAAAPPVARAREAPSPRELPELPPDPELAALAKRVLLDIAVNGGGPDAGARVGAAKALVEHTAAEPGNDLSDAEEDELLEAVKPILERRQLWLGPKLHRNARETLEALRAALPDLEEKARAEAAAAGDTHYLAAAKPAQDDGQW